MSRRARLIIGERSKPSSGRIAISPWMTIDALIWALMLILAIWMRFDFSINQLTRSLGVPSFYGLLLGFVMLGSILGWSLGFYRGRFVPGSLLETRVLTTAFAGVTLVVFLVHTVSGTRDGLPRSVPVITGAFTVITALVLRSIARRKELFGAGASDGAEAAIVFGAGSGGVQLVQQLRRSEVSQFNPVAILDDDPTKHHMLVDGVRVYGGRGEISTIAQRVGAGTLIIAAPSLAGEDLIDIRDRAESAGLYVLVLPPLHAMMRGRVAADELREINVDDLLGRKPARLNQTQIADYIRGKRIMVTGAGGSIGSELCRQLSRFRPAELMMLDRDESGLHATQLSINDQAMLDGEDTILASIRDRQAIKEVFALRRPQIVFHAAALKHMPLLESFPLEALKTNVLGTMNVLESALECGAETVVNISTDKAANPCSVLGTSKRIAEGLTASKAEVGGAGKFVSVRFGNVLGSRGSVLTVFEKQIREGGPLTVTDPDVERFFMTIPEACQLVLQAAAIGSSGDTLVLDMGDPVKISDVARILIEQSHRDIEIVYTGLRKNEKLSEELFDSSEEPKAAEDHDTISIVRVPPTEFLRGEVEEISIHEEARLWLDRNVS